MCTLQPFKPYYLLSAGRQWLGGFMGGEPGKGIYSQGKGGGVYRDLSIIQRALEGIIVERICFLFTFLLTII